MRGTQVANSDITITITVDGRNYNLKGIPEHAFRAFAQNTKQHFPDAGDDAWANAITEMILSFTTNEAYFMTDIPAANNKALDDVLSKVGWTFEQLHAYLLTAAMKTDALRIVSFREEDTTKVQLGTLLVTGLRKSTFEKLEAVTNTAFERVIGLMFQGFENGVVTFTPADIFTAAGGPPGSADSDLSRPSDTSTS